MSRNYTNRKRSPNTSRKDDYGDHYKREKWNHRYEKDNHYHESDRKRRNYDHEDHQNLAAPARILETEIKSPPGFPVNYKWSKGDWLCPSPGCEGYVTSAKFRNCIECGRSQPHLNTLMELAKNDRFRTKMCDVPNCGMRECSNAHANVELRDYKKSREYQKCSKKVPPVIPPVPTVEDTMSFCKRWKVAEPGISIMNRLPGPLADLVFRSFAVGPEVPDSETSSWLLKCLADIIRPRTVMVTPQSGGNSMMLELLRNILRVHSTPIGVACSGEGHLAVALEKEVWVLQILGPQSHCVEDLGLLAFALTFAGLSVVHSLQDKRNVRNSFPKLFVDLFDRVRVVDNPSEIIYQATDLFEQVTDRATQAKIDAISNPAPLLPTPLSEETTGGSSPS